MTNRINRYLSQADQAFNDAANAMMDGARGPATATSYVVAASFYTEEKVLAVVSTKCKSVSDAMKAISELFTNIDSFHINMSREHGVPLEEMKKSYVAVSVVPADVSFPGLGKPPSPSDDCPGCPECKPDDNPDFS